MNIWVIYRKIEENHVIGDRWEVFAFFRLAISCIRHPCIAAIMFLRDSRGDAKTTKADELSRNGCVLSSLILSDCGTATFDTHHFKRIRLQSSLRYPTTVKYMFYIVFVPRLESNQGGSVLRVSHRVQRATPVRAAGSGSTFKVASFSCSTAN